MLSNTTYDISGDARVEGIVFAMDDIQKPHICESGNPSMESLLKDTLVESI